MKIKTMFIIAGVGIAAGIASAIIYNEKQTIQPPVAVSYNPYEKGVYATGIIESYQVNGSNVNIYPEVSGKVTEVFLKEAQVIDKGTPIFKIDDTVQRGVVDKDAAQVKSAQASLVNAKDQLNKIRKSYKINHQSVSLNDLDNAINSVKIAEENVKVAQGQYEADKALLEKYTVKSSIDGTVLRIVVALGDYVSPQGSYDTYTQGMLPCVQMGVVTPYMQVRAYVDEILTPSLPQSDKLEATMFIRGMNNKSIPLQYVSLQPFTIPNIELSDERNERVDVRVLPIIFKFEKPKDINVYAGQLVDVFIKGKA